MRINHRTKNINIIKKYILIESHIYSIVNNQLYMRLIHLFRNINIIIIIIYIYYYYEIYMYIYI